MGTWYVFSVTKLLMVTLRLFFFWEEPLDSIGVSEEVISVTRLFFGGHGPGWFTKNTCFIHYNIIKQLIIKLEIKVSSK